jgi:hypothetical protein
MNLEIDKMMNSARTKFSPRLGTAGPAQRPKWPGWPVALMRGACARNIVTAPASGTAVTQRLRRISVSVMSMRAPGRRYQARLGQRALTVRVGRRWGGKARRCDGVSTAAVLRRSPRAPRWSNSFGRVERG